MSKFQIEGLSLERIAFCDFLQEETIVFVVSNLQQARQFTSLLRLAQPDYEIIALDFFDSEIYEMSFSDYEVFQNRSSALRRILTSSKKVIVTTIESLNYLVPKPSYFEEAIEIKKSQKFSMENLTKSLIEFGYLRTDVVMTPGTFAVRGGIIDLFIPGFANPIRVDFFGDEIESIKEFNRESQISVGEIKSATVTKCSEIILNEKSQHLFRQKYKFKDEHIKESVENGNYFPGIEWFQTCFHEEVSSVLEYLPSNTKFIFDFEIQKLNRMFFEKCENKFSGVANVLPVSEIFADSVTKASKKFDTIQIDPFTGNSNFQNHEKRYDIRKEFELAELIHNLKRKTVFSFKTNGAFNIARDLLKNEKIKEIQTFAEAEKDCINLIISNLSVGFSKNDLNVYTERELFGEELRFSEKKTSKDFFKDYSKLSVGDFVVHEKHGVAIFEGLVNLEVSGVAHDFIALQYQNNDKLYVPIENIDLISRYGDSGSSVQLDYLKSSAWTNRKLKVRKKLLVIANDLLKLAAKRKVNKVSPFEIPGNYNLFCRGFGHIETDDQLSAINDVLSDLTGNIPMDRLICGDVGFGKTEVALRAAFVVSSNLKQVVLLAPTTILVSQHFKTFQKRFEDFGIKVCQLSRFVPRAQLRRNLESIRSGRVQIIIATHAVLSEKIEFADLGLVIIDEEQHFGVKQKEFLKRYHENTHFMTLSATPIPRTLQLAMSGVKDLSMITTPPTNRLPVKTLICNFDKTTIGQAIENEIKIGGQVFFVTPRVEYLNELFTLVSRLFPGLKVVKVHGKSANLEEILKDFCDCKLDVLVSTNIIDSGIDIPNANTILIHRFDLFGLSQLYQLRGRVGRSKRQAYAYLLLDNSGVLSETAKKRLEVLNNLNKFGSGFNLASYDLDIRGAGNLLGEEQSGYIKEVGVELYQSMLREAILMLKAGGDISQFDKKDVQINLGVPVLIPENYISDSALRLEIYRRIGGLDSEGNVDVMEYELFDRFGGIPFETKNLLTLIRIKIHCLRSNVSKLDVGSNGITFSFLENKCSSVKGLMNFLHSECVSEDFGSFKIRNDQKIVILKKWKDVSSRTNSVYRLMSELDKHMGI